ncbi:B-box type zinc finger protein ncl-1-like [Ruditapes philippinarum]|uniref:B-box type zinc finger protein ncl-1-like n=1 Tax=Ruditapes philippinarum TaxID=129788 RepID=UPI00295ABE52|nr:B-box type zinc finger protein ncl-1-like [Ruditapes philippinarum]
MWKITKRKHIENDAGKLDVFSALCDKHPKHAIEMFCVDCDKVCCLICQATEHNSGDHKKIQTIEVAATNCVETKEFAEYEEKLSTILRRENETLSDNYKMETITAHFKQEAESLIKTYQQDLINLIEKHYKQLYKRIRLKYEKSKTRLLNVNEQLLKNKNKTSEIRQEIDEKRKSGQNVALFIAMKKSQDNLKQIENQLEEIEKLNFVER